MDTARAYNQAIVQLNPKLSTERRPLAASVGLGVAVDADQPTRDEIGDVVHVYPRAEVSVNLFRNLFVPYAKVGGGLLANNLHDVLELNPFFAPDHLDSPVVLNGQTIQASGFPLHEQATALCRRCARHRDRTFPVPWARQFGAARGFLAVQAHHRGERHRVYATFESGVRHRDVRTLGVKLVCRWESGLT